MPRDNYITERMTKTITIRELTELLSAQEAEIREEYQDKVKRLVWPRSIRSPERLPRERR
jgi:hypothetical protein